MSSKIFKNYQNPELFLTNEQVIDRIKYLTDSLRIASPNSPKEVILFPTRLTNAELASLTTI